MARDDQGAAVQPQDEIARRVHRYEGALLGVLRARPEEERTAPITPEEHALAEQIAEAVTAYERRLRRPPLPRARPEPAESEPPAAGPTVKPRKVAKRRAKKAAPARPPG